MLRCSCHYHA